MITKYKIFENKTEVTNFMYNTIEISPNFFVTIKKKNDEIHFHISKNAKKFKKRRLVSGVAQIIDTEYENNETLRNIKINNVDSNGGYVSGTWKSVCVKFVGFYTDFHEIFQKYKNMIYPETWEIGYQFRTIGDLIDEMKKIKTNMTMEIEAEKYNI